MPLAVILVKILIPWKHVRPHLHPRILASPDSTLPEHHCRVWHINTLPLIVNFVEDDIWLIRL